MDLLVRILVVIAVVGLVVAWTGWISSRWFEARRTGAAPGAAVAEFLLALVLRFFGLVAILWLLVLRGGEDRLALVSAAGVTYFAVILLDAWRRMRPTRGGGGGGAGHGA